MTDPSPSRFVVGIDLGTSNSSLAFADLASESATPPVQVFAVPQLVAPGDVQPRELLPSALYEPADHELPGDEARLPWSKPDDPRSVVGEAARRLGGKVPGRLLRSAKSWLCHGGVNRTSKILPWHAPDEVPKRSPVEASAAYLAHLRDAWDHEMAADDPAAKLAEQEVVLTVPASFDEVARQLTLQAARDAGLARVTLLEEPLAAFYAFVARTGGTTATTGLVPGQRILVIDVGGGTSDFTLIEVHPGDDREGPLHFERTAVGDHLLLGGDNMDLALAHAIEDQLGRLDAQAWSQLTLECRLAKETLFEHPSRPEIPVVLAGRGSKLIGGTRRASLDRATLDRVVLEGYFPELPPGEAALPQTATAGGFMEFGLPFARDPAITRHVAAFLLRQRGDDPVAPIDALLFNGGALRPPSVRDRLSRVLGGWMRASGVDLCDPRPLVYDDDRALDLAVAKGAAHYGLVVRGRGQRVGGGSPRTFFLGLSEADETPLRVVCIAPRGLQDGQTVEVPDREFQLVTNRPVAFPLYATAHPHPEPVGTVLEVEPDELEALPPLRTVVRFGKQKVGTKVPVRLQARHTEVGTLEVYCYSRMSGARFQLEFDLRASEERAAVATGPAAPAGHLPPVEASEVDPERIEAAKARLTELFTAAGPSAVDGAMKGLESDLGLSRGEFPINALRDLAEHMLQLIERRGRTPAHEARWLNLIGFFLRPGFGAPVDEWRVRQLWKIHGPGPVHPGHAPVQLNWWILWRRVAGGLGRGHQEELASRSFPALVPALHKRAKRKPPKPQSEEAAELWRAAASLERVSQKARTQLGDALIELIEARRAPKGALWCLGRIGARQLLYGPKETTVRPAKARDWADRLLGLPKPPKDERIEDCLLELVAYTGDRQFDHDEATRSHFDRALTERGVDEARRRRLFEVIDRDRAMRGIAYGDSLPLGLSLDGA